MQLQFTIHGVSQDLVAPVRLQLDNAQRVRATAEFDMSLQAFKVVVLMPRLMSIQDTVKVKLDLLLART
jgi:hypothetical protein